MKYAIVWVNGTNVRRLDTCYSVEKAQASFKKYKDENPEFDIRVVEYATSKEFEDFELTVADNTEVKIWKIDIEDPYENEFYTIGLFKGTQRSALEYCFKWSEENQDYYRPSLPRQYPMLSFEDNPLSALKK